VGATASTKRTLLRSLWQVAQEQRLPLYDVLLAANTVQLSSDYINAGQQIQSTTGNGESVTFKSATRINKATLVSATDDLLLLYEQCVAESSDSEPTDCDLYACMMGKIVQRKRIAGVYSGMTRP